MTAFDPELHLRLLGEAMVLGGSERHHWGSPLSTAAQALVAVRAIDVDAAQALLNEYGLASALRDGHIEHYAIRAAHRAGASKTPVEIEPRRVVPCDRSIEIGGDVLHVRSVSLGDDSTTLAITYRMQTGDGPQGLAMMGSRAMFGPGGQLNQITLEDDRGTKAGTHFGGGGSPHEWRGHLRADRPLAKDTAWIAVDGERIDLIDPQTGGEVRIEELPEESPALRHLWSALAAADQFHGPRQDLEPAIEALVAAGVLDPDDPELSDVRAVASALDRTQRGGGAGTRRVVQEPWRSLVARLGQSSGPSGTAPIGLVTPVFDGIVVSATILESGEHGFGVEVEVSPNITTRRPFGDSELGRSLAWWARDDNGNHYLGQTASWGGSETRGEGSISFTPPLDPSAARLELMPTTERSRAIMSFPLRWSAQKART